MSELTFSCAGRVELRNALAAIKRHKPQVATIMWSFRKRKSDDDLPAIEVPDGTVLTIFTLSGIPRFRLVSGRVVFVACSAWGNVFQVHGGELHVRTDGADRKVTIDAEPGMRVTTTADEIGPGSRLHMWRLDPVVVQDRDFTPLSWLESVTPR